MSGHRTSCDRAGRSSGRESLGSRRTAGAFGWRGYAGPRRPPGKRYGLPILIRRRRRLTPCAPGGCRGEPQAEWRHAGMVLAVEAASFGGLVLCPDMTPYGLCRSRRERCLVPRNGHAGSRARGDGLAAGAGGVRARRIDRRVHGGNEMDFGSELNRAVRSSPVPVARGHASRTGSCQDIGQCPRN